MSADEWNEEQLLRMIDEGVEESLHLDYKAAGALQKDKKKREEIVKDVTAFANADGGVIIYGVAEFRDRAKAHLPEKLDPVLRSEISKEWLEHVIGSAAPPIDSVRIYPVPIGDDGNQAAYVVEIPKSSTAHQARDHRYYRRRNFESRPMEDYEIRETMNRIDKPVVEAQARLTLNRPGQESCFLVKLTNTGKVMARHYLCVVDLPPISESYGAYILENCNDVPFNESDQGGWAFQFELGQGSGISGSPLFPGRRTILRRKLAHGKMREPEGAQLRIGAPLIRLSIYADSNPPLVREIEPVAIVNRWG